MTAVPEDSIEEHDENANQDAVANASGDAEDAKSQHEGASTESVVDDAQKRILRRQTVQQIRHTVSLHEESRVLREGLKRKQKKGVAHTWHVVSDRPTLRVAPPLTIQRDRGAGAYERSVMQIQLQEKMRIKASLRHKKSRSNPKAIATKARESMRQALEEPRSAPLRFVPVTKSVPTPLLPNASLSAGLRARREIMRKNTITSMSIPDFFSHQEEKTQHTLQNSSSAPSNISLSSSGSMQSMSMSMPIQVQSAGPHDLSIYDDVNSSRRLIMHASGAQSRKARLKKKMRKKKKKKSCFSVDDASLNRENNRKKYKNF